MGTHLEELAVRYVCAKEDAREQLQRWLAQRLGRSEAGQSTVEYAVVAAVVVVAAITALNAFTGGVAQVFGRIVTRIQGVG